MDVKARLVQFETPGSACRVGVQLGDGGRVVDVCAAQPSLPRDMRSFIQNWDTNLPLAAKYVLTSCACPASLRICSTFVPRHCVHTVRVFIYTELQKA